LPASHGDVGAANNLLAGSLLRRYFQLIPAGRLFQIDAQVNLHALLSRPSSARKARSGRPIAFDFVSGARFSVPRAAASLGVDLEKAPGRYELKVTAQKGLPARRLFASANITVRAGKFATERLRVEKEFVEPNPEQVKRANEERDRLREIFDRVTPERLWNGKFRVPLDGVTGRLEFREAANSKRKSWVAPWRCGFAGDDRNARACRAAGQGGSGR